MNSHTQQTIRLHSRVHRPLKAQPITYGVPWPQGAVADADQLRMRDSSSRPRPAAFTVLNRWPDGSVQWSLIDFMLDFEPSDDIEVTISTDSAETVPIDHPVEAKLDGQTATIGNGVIELALSAQAGGLLERWTVGAKPLVEPDGLDITFTDDQGTKYSLKAGPRKITIEHANPLRAIVRLDGKHADENGGEWLDYFLRFELCADRKDVAITYSFRNHEQPVPGIEIRSLYAHVQTTVDPGAKRLFTACNRTRHYLNQFMRVDEDPVIVATDTGDLENYAKTHEPRKHGDCFVANPEVLHDPPETKPWYLQDPSYRKAAGGNKCVWPYLGLLDDDGGVVTCFKKMNTLHPKSLTATGSTLELGICPQWAGPLNITQGAGRSHTIYLAPIAGGAGDMEVQNQYLSWEMGGVYSHTPSLDTIEISPDINHVRRSSVFAIDMLPEFDPDEHFLFERKVLDTWIGVSYGQLGAVDHVVPWPAVGFWDYGDNGLSNNEEMNALVYFQNHLRTGNWACAEKGIAAATHIMEVDHCAFSIDRLQNGGQVAHCNNHNDGAAYPSHMWFTELLFAYVLTGDRQYKDAALRICENLLTWINDPEGFAIISSDQREAGQPMINLTWCYQFNPDQRYLDACRKIIYEYLMANTHELGRMLDKIPQTMPVKIASYGDYASYEGMFWYWKLTGDEKVKDFMLSQFQWRVTERYSGVHGFHRCTDYNPAAYAWYLTGDRSWLDRVARPLRACFGAAQWPIGWVHAMYAIKIAFDLGIIKDDDITVR